MEMRTREGQTEEKRDRQISHVTFLAAIKLLDRVYSMTTGMTQS